MSPANKYVHFIGQRMPRPMKDLFLRVFWRLKSLYEDWIDYATEVVGTIPSHTLRLLWLKGVCRTKIGHHSSIHRRCRLIRPNKIIIGDHSIINYGVFLGGRSGLTIGDNVSISDGVAIISLGHDMDDPDFVLKGGEVIIEDYVFIGSYARILPGVRIGKGAVVGVGSVVTRNVEPFTIVGGSPARFIRNRNCDLKYQLDYRKKFG